MSVRTNPAKVKKVLTGDYDSVNNPGLLPFIVTASKMTDRAAAYGVQTGITLTSNGTNLLDDLSDADEQTVVETWLAAHFYKYARDKALTAKTTAGASGQFQGKTDMYLEGTYYGQNAIMADATGWLRSRSKNARVGGRWLGKPVSTQTAYRDRS